MCTQACLQIMLETEHNNCFPSSMQRFRRPKLLFDSSYFRLFCFELFSDPLLLELYYFLTKLFECFLLGTPLFWIITNHHFDNLSISVLVSSRILPEPFCDL